MMMKQFIFLFIYVYLKSQYPSHMILNLFSALAISLRSVKGIAEYK